MKERLVRWVQKHGSLPVRELHRYLWEMFDREGGESPFYNEFKAAEILFRKDPRVLRKPRRPGGGARWYWEFQIEDSV